MSLMSAPDALVTWAQDERRSLNGFPKIGDVGEFASQWRNWWTMLQPDWRTKSRRGGKTWPLKRSPFPGDEKWEGVAHQGEMGHWLLLVALAWWSAALKSLKHSSKERKDWNSAVDDALWVFQQILHNIDH